MVVVALEVMIVPMVMMMIITVRVIMFMRMIVAMRVLPVGALLWIERRFHR